MVVTSWGGDVVHLGQVTEMHCEQCGQECPFELVMTYRYWGFYWVFTMVTSRKYYLTCQRCQAGFALEKEQVERELLDQPVPLPFMRRYGLATLMAVIGLFGLAGLVLSV